MEGKMSDLPDDLTVLPREQALELLRAFEWRHQARKERGVQPLPSEVGVHSLQLRSVDVE